MYTSSVLDKKYGWAVYPFLILIIGVIVYLNSLGNGFIRDDSSVLVQNKVVHNIENIPKLFTTSAFYVGESDRLGGVFYRPLMMVSFSIIYSFVQDTPFVYHLIQVLLHIMCALVLFYLFRTFFNKNISFILSIVFLVHPMNSESASFIAALQEPLYLLFGLSAFLAIRLSRKNNKLVVIVPIFLLLSILAKEAGIIFFFSAAILGIIQIVADGNFKKNEYIKNITPLFVAIGTGFSVYLILRFIIAGFGLSSQKFAPIMQASFTERLISIPKVFFYYIKTFIFPRDLAVDQSWVVKQISFFDFYIPLFGIIILIIAIVYGGYWLFRKKTILIYWYIFFGLTFIIGMSLHIQILPLDLTVSDRWFYFPMICVLGMIGCIVSSLRIKSENIKKVIISALILIIMILAIRTHVRNNNWQDNITLAEHDLKIAPDSFQLNSILGVEYSRLGRYDDAEKYLKKSVELNPNWAVSWNNLGVLYIRMGKPDEAKEAFKKSIQIGKLNLAYENMALLLLIYDTPEKAHKYTTDLIKIYPTNNKLWWILAYIEYKRGNLSGALAASEKAYSISPDKNNFNLYNSLRNGSRIDIPSK